MKNGFFIILSFAFLYGCFHKTASVKSERSVASDSLHRLDQTQAKYCTGTTNDGENESFPLYNLRIRMAGGQQWVPGSRDLYTHSAHSVPSLKESQTIFQTSQTLKMRIKANTQPSLSSRTLGTCDGITKLEKSPSYEALSARLTITDRECLGKNTIPCQKKTISYKVPKINVDTCSSVIDFSTILTDSIKDPVVKVDKVHGFYGCDDFDNCEVKKLASTQCWDIVLQVATDSTDDFIF